MKKHIKTIVSLTLAVALISGIFLSGKVTKTPMPNGGQYGSLSQTLVRTYRSAMILYDLAMTDPVGIIYVPGNVFLDPHEAWDSYITNQKPNNWFEAWYHDYTSEWGGTDEGAKGMFNATQEPNNLYPDSPEWWARLDSYVTNVITEDHVVDPNITWKASDTEGSPYHPETFTFEDEMWAEWYDITQDYPDLAEYAPYQGMSLQEWTEMRTTMSDEEDALFDEWWNSCRPWKKPVGKTFNEYKESKGFSENKPTQPSMKPIPTVTPTATPVPTPSVAPTTTPEPTPTATPVPVETQPVQHFADVSPDAWYYEAVNNMAEAGILKGKGDGLFHPNDNITNAEVATIICRIGQSASERYRQIGDPTNRRYDERVVNNPSHWAERAIEAAKASTNNDSTSTFFTNVDNANTPCKRYQVFGAIQRLAYENQFPQYWHYEFPWKDHPEWAIKKLNVTDEDRTNLMDVVLDWNDAGYLFDILDCWKLGIIHGDGTGHVYPKSNITRAELCQILYNMGAKTCYLDL